MLVSQVRDAVSKVRRRSQCAQDSAAATPSFQVAYASAELAIPKPPTIAGNAGHDRAVWQRDRGTFRFAIYHARDERHGVGTDLAKLLLCSNRTAAVVGGPTLFERRDIAREVLGRRPD
jgi:hypothetical protein